MCIESKLRKNINRRVGKTLHKKYRRYQSDIWGRLAAKKKCNFITALVYQAALRKFNNLPKNKKVVKSGYTGLKRGGKVKRTLKGGSNVHSAKGNDKKSQSKGKKGVKKKNKIIQREEATKWTRLNKRRKLIIQRLYNIRGKVQAATTVTRFFFYRTTNKAPSRRKRGLSFRGLLLRNRRQISLYYGGGRIRKKTFRRYGKMLKADHKKRKVFGLAAGYNSFSSIIESRIDVLLFRANFVDTIYQARHFVFHRKVRVRGRKVITNPGFLVKTYELFMLRDDYWRKMRMKLLNNIMEKRIIGFPSYLYINFAVMIAFKLEDPFASTIRYPFSEVSIADLAMFRHSFRIL
jgi:ribosomal protein S4